MRWHYRDALLVWLFPLAFGLHILEEWFGGFPDRATIAREEHGWMGILPTPPRRVAASHDHELTSSHFMRE